MPRIEIDYDGDVISAEVEPTAEYVVVSRGADDSLRVIGAPSASGAELLAAQSGPDGEFAAIRGGRAVFTGPGGGNETDTTAIDRLADSAVGAEATAPAPGHPSPTRRNLVAQYAVMAALLVIVIVVLLLI